MNNDIYAIIRRYATSEGTLENHYNDDGYADWLYKPENYYDIYNKMMEITEGDHEISSDAASWCELACIGERYEFREGEIEIMKIE